MVLLKKWKGIRYDTFLVIIKFALMVPGAGLEPARPNEHMPLKHACLPISAPGLIFLGCKNTVFFLF